MKRLVAIVFILMCCVVVFVAHNARAATTANLWISAPQTGDTTRNCVRKSSPATYVASDACSSFNAAYSAASGSVSDTVLVKGGSYAAFSPDTKNSRVVFTAAAGETVNLAQSLFGTGKKNVTLDGMTLAGIDIGNQVSVGWASEITVKNSIVNGQIMMRTNGGSSLNVLFDNNKFMPWDKSYSGSPGEGRLTIAWPGWNPDNGDPPQQDSGVKVTNNEFVGHGCSDGIQLGAAAVLIQNNVFHDITQQDNGHDCADAPYGAHVDALQLYGSMRSKIIGNFFYNNTTGIIAYNGGSQDEASNNLVWNTDREDEAIGLGGEDNPKLDHNTTDGQLNVAGSTGAIVTNNIADSIWLKCPPQSDPCGDYGTFGTNGNANNMILTNYLDDRGDYRPNDGGRLNGRVAPLGTGSFYCPWTDSSTMTNSNGTQAHYTTCTITYKSGPSFASRANALLANGSGGKGAGQGGTDIGIYLVGTGADINSDGVINGADISLLIADFGKSVGQATTAGADVNTDGVINGADLSTVVGSYGH